jgi:hypothetical protein
MIRRRLEDKALKEGTIITPEFMAAYRKQREQELGFEFAGGSYSTPRRKDHA